MIAYGEGRPRHGNSVENSEQRDGSKARAPTESLFRFDEMEVGAAGRQEERFAAQVLDRVTDTIGFVGRQVAHEDDVAGNGSAPAPCST